MLRVRLIALASIALISLIATGWVSDRSRRLMTGAVAALDDTRDTLLAVDGLRAALGEAESDARGYAITRTPALRVRFEQDVPAIHAAFERLKARAREPRQRDLTNHLEELLAHRVTFLQALISAEQQGGSPSDIYAIVVNGTAVARAATDVLDQIRAEETRQFDEEASRAESVQRFAMYGPLVMCLVAVIMFVTMLIQFTATLRADVAARETLRQAIALEQAARARAQEADQMKDQFLATVSHELRTPLTAIIGWCGLLSIEDSRRALLDEGLASIHDAARIQSQLIEDLLDVSRVVAGKVHLSIEEVNVADIVEKAIASVAPAARGKGITIRRHFDAQTRTCVADPDRLQQIIWNLLSNSIKFTQEGGSIDIDFRYTDSEVEITVRDNGRGIGPDLLPHIFDRFRQGDATAGRPGGLGLGLSIVKSLVELHGGSVVAESEGAGKGATFTVRLPLSRPQEAGGSIPIARQTLTSALPAAPRSVARR